MATMLGLHEPELAEGDGAKVCSLRWMLGCLVVGNKSENELG